MAKILRSPLAFSSVLHQSGSSTRFIPGLLAAIRSGGALWGLIWLVLVALLLPGLVRFFDHSWQVLGWEWQIDFDEGFNLDAAWKLAGGTNIYGQPTPDRFIAAPYPPVYYLLTAGILKLTGLSLAGGRWLSFGTTLVIAGLLAGLALRAARRYFQVSRFNAWMAGGLAAVSWLALNPTLIWGTFYKQDMVAMALALGGLGVLWRSRDFPASYRRVYLAAGLLALGFYTKQNELAACATATLYFGLHDRRRWHFGAALLLMLVVPFAGLDLLTRHRFYFNLLEAQQVPWRWEDLWRRLTTRVLADHLGLLALATGFGLAEIWRVISHVRKEHRYRPGLVLIWLAGGTGTLITVGSYQSGYNHALNFFPPVLVAATAMLAGLIERAGNGSGLALGWKTAALAASGWLAWQTLTYADPALYYSAGNFPSPARQEMLQGLVRQIQQTPGDILSEDIYLQLKTGRPVVYDDLYHMALQAGAGQWNERKFLADLQARRFSLVLLGMGSRRFTDAGWEALNANYRLIFPDGIALWRPRPQPLWPQYPAADCTFGEGLKYLGVSYGQASGSGSGSGVLNITSYWQARPQAAARPDYTLFVHLLDENGKLVAQRDEPPRGWRVADPRKLAGQGLDFPTTSAQSLPVGGWPATGEWLLVDQTLPLPDSARPGQTYRVSLGFYRVAADGKLEPLPVTCAPPGESQSDTLELPAVTVVK